MLIYKGFLIDKWLLKHFAPIFVGGQNGSEGVVE